MKIAIVGWGIEGQSAYKYFGATHDYLIVNEHPPIDLLPQGDNIQTHFLTADKPPGITGNVHDLSYLDNIEDCDKIVYTPTSRKNLEQKFGEDSAFWTKATSAMHIFFETVQTKNIIGVTGTKGKGTTSTLIYQMLMGAGKTTYLGGNIGRSVLDFVHDVQPDHWVVLELSNFQLYKFPYSPHLAVCLMVVPEHLDWHPNTQDYLDAKTNIFSHQKPDDIAIYYDQNKFSRELAFHSPGLKIPFFQTPGASVRSDGQIVIGQSEVEIIHKSEVKLLGAHNLQNICAAITAAWQVTQDVEAIRKVLTTFSGLEHRLEFVRELNGVKYYDDSFSTNPSTTTVAVQAFNQPKVIILGGVDKGLDLAPMIEAVSSSNVGHVIAIGSLANKIAEMLRQKGFTSVTTGLNNMPDIVKKARAAAQPGDVVLLSPGSSSFDMFKDYKTRGEEFKKAVQALV